ncbi:MAG: non-homologous end-joining DNA ligase [Syntrophomonadaceae bacterium]|nr:non-homologous end-joining DNA ligase [Syntrophomonadaceae bacterium]
MENLLKKYKAMEPIKRDDVFDREDFLYQIKWDGVRILAGMADSTVSLINKRGNSRTVQFPELQTLPGLVAADSAILDGEIVVLRDGKPSFPAVMQRDRTTNPAAINMLTGTLPLVYMVFDILYLNGEDLRNQPLSKRIDLLPQLFTDQDYLFQVQSFPEGSTLFEAVKNADLEGIVAKRKNSLYRPGKQHEDWYKIKCLRHQNCLVGGYTLRGQQVNSLLLGVLREGKLSFAGKAANGLNTGQWQVLSRELPGLRIRQSPFADSNPPNACFIKPQLAVQVEFLEWTDSLQFRFPVIKSFINAAASDCSV